MKTLIRNTAVLAAVGLLSWNSTLHAQTAVSTTQHVTTTTGAFTEFVPTSRTVVLRTEAHPEPVAYMVTETTTVVDEAGAPVAVAQIPAGAPLSVQYDTVGGAMVAQRIVVQKVAAPTTSTTVVTDGPTVPSATTSTVVVEEAVPAPTPVVLEETVTTTTTTTAPGLTEDEREEKAEALEERREERREAIEDARD